MSRKPRKLHELAVRRFKTAIQGWRHIYEDALDDLRFVYDVDGGQWPLEVRKERGNRPMLTVNKLQKFVRNVIAGVIQNKPRIKVIPVDNKGDVKVAELYDAIIRKIEYISKAKIAFTTAYTYAVACGIGFFRIITDYVNPMSFDQDIFIKRIANPFSVYFDPAVTEPTFEDARYCFIEDWIPKEEFEAKYPRANLAEFSQSSIGSDEVNWFDEDRVKVVEYFWKEPIKKKIYQLSTGDVVDASEVEPEVLEQQGVQIVKERETTDYQIKWCKLSGAEILEGPQIWPGRYIPVIPVLGDEIIVNGKRYVLSLIRGAKQPQRMYNYWATAATEHVALSPKQPYIVDARTIEGFEAEWQEANVKNRMFLRYKYIPGIPPPTRQQSTPIPAAVVNMMQLMHFDLEDQLGKYEAFIGRASNERSGKAILARQQAASRNSFVFVDNFVNAILYTGRVLVDLIPKIYDTERAISILGEDGSVEKVIEINKPIGDRVENDLSIGEYDVVVTVGPSYESMRQEAVDMLIQAMQYAPQLAPIIAPLVFKYSDWPGAQEVYQQLKNALAQMQTAQAPEEGSAVAPEELQNILGIKPQGGIA